MDNEIVSLALVREGAFYKLVEVRTFPGTKKQPVYRDLGDATTRGVALGELIQHANKTFKIQ